MPGPCLRALRGALLALALSACTTAPGGRTPVIPTPPAASRAAPTSSASVEADGTIAVVEARDEGADENIRLVNPDGGPGDSIPRSCICQNEGPSWAAASGEVLFDSARSGRIHLFRFDPVQATVEQLTQGDRYEGFPAASPDGTTIAFDYSTEAASLGISLMDIDGSDIKVLVPPPDPPAFDSAPAFSPDGRQVAFIRKRSQTPPNAREAAFIVNIDGSGLRQLTAWDLDVGRIRWSADGTRLTFSDKAENQTEETSQDVFLINADGTGLVNVTRNAPGHHTFDPDWSPDGSRLVALDWTVGDVRHETMVTMDPDGTDIRTVYTSQDGWFLEWPAWGPADRERS